MKHKWLLSLTAAPLLILMTACGGAGAPEVAEELTQEPIVETLTEAQSPPEATSSSPSNICPLPTGGTVQYINEAGGYCFLYPIPFELRINQPPMDQYDANLIGPALDESMEPLLAWMSIGVIAKPGAAAAITAAQYADEKMADDPLMMGMVDAVTRSETTVAGIPAVVLDGIPGQIPGREVYLVANDTLYVLHIAPANGVAPAAQPDVDLVWNTVTGSLAFFPPPLEDVVTAEEVCPTPGEGQQLILNKIDGVCYLLPADWQPDTTIPNSYFGGPEIPGMAEWIFPRNHVGVNVSYAYSNDGRTVEAIADERASINPTTVVTQRGLTIGGYPAVVTEDSVENLSQRAGLVDVNGVMYSIHVSPTNAEAYPESQPTADEVWNLITTTVQFFTPWR